MRMHRGIRDQLLALAPAPPECGGILGGRDGIITELVLDTSKPEHTAAVYTPDTAFLNGQLVQWQAQGIAFLGMFHTHPKGQPALSTADQMYIAQIMAVMPASVEELYFPIVLPGEAVYGFRAERTAEGLVIAGCAVELC